LKNIIILLLVVGVIYAGVKVFADKQKPSQEVAQQLADSLNSYAPIAMNEQTRMDGASFSNGQLVFKITLLDFEPGDEIELGSERELKTDMITNYCADSDSVKLMKDGIELKSRYSDTGGNVISEVSVIASDCP